jgi:hypothetical protein
MLQAVGGIIGYFWLRVRRRYRLPTISENSE